MFKRAMILTSGILVSLSTPAMAREIYIGIGVGPDFAKIQENASVYQVQNGILNFNVKNDNQLAATGVFGTIFAGYGSRFNIPQISCTHQNAYLAGELNANLSSLKYKTSNDEFVHSSFSSTTFRMNHYYGISIIPGYVYNESTLLYGRLGYSRGNFKVSSTDTSIGNKHQDLNGLRWGLGVRQMLTERVAMRVDYSHVNYANTTLSTLDTLSNTSKTTHITPQTNEVEFSLMYLFC